MFDIEGGKIKLSANALAIPPFKEHYNNALDKVQALKEIEYIVWCYKWNTPYAAYALDQRKVHAAVDVFKTEDYVPTKEVEVLAERFLEFQATPLIRLYLAAEEGLEYLINTLKTLRANAEAEEDSLLKDKLKIAVDVSRLLKDVEPTAKSLDNAKKRAMAEQVETGRVKGGGTLGLYEMPKQHGV